VPAYLRDNVKARILLPDGSHQREHGPTGEPHHRCQEELLTIRPAIAPLDVAATTNGDEAKGSGVFL